MIKLPNNILLKKAFRYIDDVLSGKEITTWEVKRQCEIILEDYKVNQFKEDFEFYFDEEQVLKINNLLKLINYATGYVAGQCVLDGLANFQAFFIVNIFGWRFKDKPYQFRFNDITLFIARKNSKTFTVAIVYLLLMLTEQAHSEFYSICLTKELSAEIRKAMAQIIDASPMIKKHFTVSKTITGRITCKLTNSFFEPRTADARKNNSIRPNAVVSDEHGNFKDISNFLAMKSGQRNVLNPLSFRTTTAYSINNSIMEMEDLPYIRSVLNGEVNNPRQLALIYYADKENLWNDTGIYQANPLRVEENYNIIREARKEALLKSSAKEEYLTKSMNIFVQEGLGEIYIPLEAYDKCVVDEAPIDLHNQPLFIGLDLARRGDLCGVTFQFPFTRESDGLLCQFVENFSFLPNMEILEEHIRTDKALYNIWLEQGHVFVTDSPITDQQCILDFCYKKIEELQPSNVIWCIDPNNSSMLTTQLLEDNQNVYEIYQSAKHIGEATNGLKELTLEGRIYYKKNDCFRWQLGNAYIKSDENGLVKIDKSPKVKNRARIDNVDSTINSNKLAMFHKPIVDLNKKILSDDFVM